MIKYTFYIDVMTHISKGLNYKERNYDLTAIKGETYSITVRTVLDRAYNHPYNSYKDYFQRIAFKFEGRFIPVYPAEEFKLLENSVGGRNNLELGKIVGMTFIHEGRELVVFYIYE